MFNIFHIFDQNIDCGYTVLTGTHYLCFRAKQENNEHPCQPQFYYINVGCKGVYNTRTCSHDGKFPCIHTGVKVEIIVIYLAYILGSTANATLRLNLITIFCFSRFIHNLA